MYAGDLAQVTAAGLERGNVMNRVNADEETLSVVIGTYNRIDQLQVCIRSIFEQTMQQPGARRIKCRNRRTIDNQLAFRGPGENFDLFRKPGDSVHGPGTGAPSLGGASGRRGSRTERELCEVGGHRM